MNVRHRKGRGARGGDRWLAHLVRLLLVVFAVSSLVTGCEVVSDIQAEMRAEEIARKYGEELPDDELGPYRGFTREEYFRHKCDSEAGEFIYKTVENVESVYQMRLRDPRDFIDRLRKGDIPEDPWGHADAFTRAPWRPFVSQYHFFETARCQPDRGDRWKRNVYAERPPSGDSPYWRYRLGEPDGRQYLNNRLDDLVSRPLIMEPIEQPQSRYGFTWCGVRDKYDRHFGVWGGEISVVDLDTDEVLAVTRGFFDSRYAICPKRGSCFIAPDFVAKVLKPKPFDPVPLDEHKGAN